MPRRPFDGDVAAASVEDHTHAQPLKIVEHADAFNQLSAGNLAPLRRHNPAQIGPGVCDVVAIHEQVFRELHGDAILPTISTLATPPVQPVSNPRDASRASRGPSARTEW